MDKLKVLVVDDVSVYRKIISEAVERTELATTEHTASNGSIALEWLAQCKVDVVILDVLMPGMNGIETLEAIKKNHPSAEVIMISGGSPDNVQITMEALKLGAIDFIMKPTESNFDKNMDIIKSQLKGLLTQIQLKMYSKRTLSADSSPAKPDQPERPRFAFEKPANTVVNVPPFKKSTWNGADLVLIASSTGGPSALETVFSGIPAGFNKPILLVQHMPPTFTKILAQTIGRKFNFEALEGSDGEVIKGGKIFVAPGGFHMIIQQTPGSEKKIGLETTPYVNGVRPAADVLFKSVASAYEGRNILAVVLTGMGSDGMRGVEELKKKCNCYCITQSEATCVVYGMPRSVFEAGLSDETADLQDIPKRIQQVSNGRS